MIATTLPGAIDNSDEQLSRRVLNFLVNKQPAGRGKIDVYSDGGVVTLRGTVATFYQRQLCIHSAQRVAGVLRVIDELYVRPLAVCRS